jgi:NADPH2:quinone reductase
MYTEANEVTTMTMKAAVLGTNGCMLVELPRPQPGPEQVLVRVRAGALNRADLGMLAGRMHGGHGGVGAILGRECAGEVAETGARVSGFKPGDRVMCSAPGAFAQYALTDWGRVMHVPAPSMSYEQATCLPIAVQTMHDALVTNGRLSASDAVLIQGASSGVGLMALQIARLMGAKLVIGTSTNKARRERLADFGADLALDSSEPDWPRLAVEANGGSGIDLIVDQLSGPVANQNLEAAALEARIINVGRMAGMRAEFDFDLHALKRIRYIGVTFRTRTAEEVREITARALADLEPHLRSGKLSLPIDRIYPLDQLGEAFSRMQANQHFGKIVVSVP